MSIGYHPLYCEQAITLAMLVVTRQPSTKKALNDQIGEAEELLERVEQHLGHHRKQNAT